MSNRSLTLILLLLAFLVAGCVKPTDGEGNDLWLSVRVEEFPPPTWIAWNQTSSGEARTLVGQAIETWRANASMTRLAEDQATLVQNYLRSEWRRAGGNGTTGAYPIEHEGGRVLVGIDSY